jgi:hypothetical protein
MMILRQSMADPTSQNGEPSAKKLGTPKAKQSYALGSQNSGQRHRAEGTRAQLHATGRLRKLPAGT